MGITLIDYEVNTFKNFESSAPKNGEVVLLARGGMKFGNKIYTSTSTGSGIATWDDSKEGWALDGLTQTPTSWTYEQASEPLSIVAVCASYQTEQGEDNTTNLNSCQSIVITVAGKLYTFTVVKRIPHGSYVYLEVEGPEIILENSNQSILFSVGIPSTTEKAIIYIGTYFEDGDKIGYSGGHFDDAILEDEYYESAYESLEVEIGSVTKTYYIWKKNEDGQVWNDYRDKAYLLTEDFILPNTIDLYSPYFKAYFMGRDAAGTYFKSLDEKLHYPVSQSIPASLLAGLPYGGYVSSLDTSGSIVQFGSTTIQLPSDFDPIYNNVMNNTVNSYAKVVETISGSDGVEIVLETPANIPDSFYTEMSNISGRYLGTKNALGRKYVRNKEEFSRQNYEILYEASNRDTGYIEVGEDDPFFSVQAFSGSVFVSGSNTGSIHSLSDNLSNMEISVLAFAPGKRYELSPTSSAVGMVVETTSSTLPKAGDIIYNSLDDLEHRVTEALIYVPEVGQSLRTNKYGIVEGYTNL